MHGTLLNDGLSYQASTPAKKILCRMCTILEDRVEHFVPNDTRIEYAQLPDYYSIAFLEPIAKEVAVAASPFGLGWNLPPRNP